MEALRVLCNLPLECFEPREHFGSVELLTYGPGDRMWVDGIHFPFDLEFDPSTGSVHELWRRLPPGFQPDLLLLYWPEQEPLPRDLQDCPVPVVGVVSDYNLSLPHISGLWPFFDVLLVDRPGADLFRRLSFADVRPFCQFSFKRSFHRLRRDVPRDLDLAFAGNLDSAFQRDREPWVERVRRLSDLGVNVELRSGLSGEDYGRFLCRARIGFNRSIRGEMNLRAFEVPACGALLLMERENVEVREFLEPDEEVVLYDASDLEDVVLDLLADEPRRQRIAAAGHRRIQQYSMGRRLDALLDVLSRRGPGRPLASAADLALGRGVAMLQTWAPPEATARALVAAADLAPSDPRPLNALGLATLLWRGTHGAVQAVELWEKAAAMAPRYVPAALNAACLLDQAGRPDLASSFWHGLQARCEAACEWSHVDGPVLPLGYSAASVDSSIALQAAIASGEPERLARHWLERDARATAGTR